MTPAPVNGSCELLTLCIIEAPLKACIERSTWLLCAIAAIGLRSSLPTESALLLRIHSCLIASCAVMRSSGSLTSSRRTKSIAWAEVVAQLVPKLGSVVRMRWIFSWRSRQWNGRRPESRMKATTPSDHMSQAAV
jgi:hypothetical protein